MNVTAKQVEAEDSILIDSTFHKVAHVTPSWSKLGHLSITLSNGTVLVEKPDTVVIIEQAEQNRRTPRR
jgi:hypothetical protein